MHPLSHGVIAENGPTVFKGSPPIPATIRGVSMVGPTTGTSHVVPVPAGTIEGDFMDMVVYQRDATPNVSCPEFPFLSFGEDVNNDLMQTVDSRIATASEPSSYTVTTDDADTVIILVVFKGGNDGEGFSGVSTVFQTGTEAILLTLDTAFPPPSTQVGIIAAANGVNPVSINTPIGYYELLNTGEQTSIAAAVFGREWPRFFQSNPRVRGPTDPATYWITFAAGFRSIP